MKSLSISLVDDHKLFRRGLRTLLESQSRFQVIHEVSNGKEILTQLKEKTSQIVLLDVEMPEYDGLYALKRIRVDFPSIKVIMLSMHKDEGHISNFMRLGANGYLFKDCEPQELYKAIESVYMNGFYFNDNVSFAMLNALVSDESIQPTFNADPQFNALEIQVMRLICKQLTTQEISDEICRGIRTVEGYRRNLLQKTGAKNIAGLVVYAIRAGYFSTDEADFEG